MTLPASWSTIGLAVLTVLIALALWQINQIRNRLKQLFGEESSDLEQILKHIQIELKGNAKVLNELDTRRQAIEANLALASQKVSIVRFNPFGDTGGDQSFAIAVLDGQDSGYVLTSIHGRQGTRVYVKPVDYGKSKYTLSTEEKLALKQAKARTATLKEAK